MEKRGRKATVITFLFIHIVHGMGILWLLLVFQSDTVISLKLSDLTSIFRHTAEVWNKLKIPLHPNMLFLRSLSCLQALQYTKLEHPLIGMVIRKCILKFC